MFVWVCIGVCLYPGVCLGYVPGVGFEPGALGVGFGVVGGGCPAG